jgi:cytoplasmic iron level regulating protein YaaA (DUF328/UPF0246 family)
VLILIPPSETKRDGGDPSAPLDLGSLSFPDLTAPRRRATAALVRLSGMRTAATALKLGPTQLHEIDRNRALESAPTMSALDRFDGVLFEGLDAPTLSAPAREFAAGHLAIASALFGLVRAEDRIPAYRLSPDSRLPRLTLKTLWVPAVSAVLAAEPGMILDLRSEAYAALGPRPHRSESWYLRVVSEAADGRRRALNHFNKKGKGEFVRALLDSAIDHPHAESLLAWATSAGIGLELTGEHELTLVV